MNYKVEIENILAGEAEDGSVTWRQYQRNTGLTEKTDAILALIEDACLDSRLEELGELKKLIDYSKQFASHSNTHVMFETYKQIDDRISTLKQKKEER